MTTAAATGSPKPSTSPSSAILSSLYRLSGTGVAGGCAVMALGECLRLVSGSDPASRLLAIGWFLVAFGAAVAVLGLPGLYTGIAGRIGALGTAGLAGIGIYLIYFGVFGGLLHALAVPGLLEQGATRPVPVNIGFIVSVLLAVSGSLALGVAMRRAHAMAGDAALLLMSGGLALFLGHPIRYVEDLGLLLLLAGLGWTGVRLREHDGVHD